MAFEQENAMANNPIDDLEELSKKAQGLDGKNDVPLDELFPYGFMRRYTDFNSIDEFFEVGPWTVESEDDLEEIPEDEMDEYVDDHTRFPNWEQMIGTAREAWTAKQLGL